MLVANLTARPRTIEIVSGNGRWSAGVLDETTLEPARRGDLPTTAATDALSLRPFAVARLVCT